MFFHVMFFTRKSNTNTSYKTFLRTDNKFFLKHCCSNCVKRDNNCYHYYIVFILKQAIIKIITNKPHNQVLLVQITYVIIQSHILYLNTYMTAILFRRSMIILMKITCKQMKS